MLIFIYYVFTYIFHGLIQTNGIMRQILQILSFVAIFFCVKAASLEAEQTSEAAEFRFYQTSASSWNERDYTSKLQEVVSAKVNDFCSKTPMTCGLKYWDTDAVFSSSDVGLTSGFPKDDGKNILLKFFIQFPSGANISSASSTHYVVNKAACEAIAKNVRKSIEAMTDLYVTYIGSTFYGIPPADLMNKIMIPVAIFVLFIVIILAVALHIWSKRRNKRRHKMERRLTRSSKVSPAHPIAIKTAENPLKNLNRNDMWYAEKQSQMGTQDLVAPINATQSVNEFTENAAINNKMNHQRNRELPPLLVENEEERHRERKRRKKRKKHRSRDDEAYENRDTSESENALSYNLSMSSQREIRSQETTILEDTTGV